MTTAVTWAVVWALGGIVAFGFMWAGTIVSMMGFAERRKYGSAVLTFVVGIITCLTWLYLVVFMVVGYFGIATKLASGG